jgi:hypothetical protein
MLRKTILALATSVTLGAAALAPSAASAHGWGGWHGPFFHVYAGPVYAGPAYGGCTVQRWVYTPVGPRLRWVNVCY